MQITLDIPNKYVLNATPADLAKELKLYAALLLYHAGQLSAGAACEYADIDRYTFIDACDRYKISAMNYDETDLMNDMKLLERGVFQ